MAPKFEPRPDFLKLKIDKIDFFSRTNYLVGLIFFHEEEKCLVIISSHHYLELYDRKRRQRAVKARGSRI